MLSSQSRHQRATAKLGLILSARLAVIPQYRHERLTVVPVLLGVRVR